MRRGIREGPGYKSITKAIRKVPLFGECLDSLLGLRKARHRIPFVKQVLPKNGIGAELGVLKGHFSPTLLQHTHATELHLVDPWYFIAGHWQWAHGNQSTVDALIRVMETLKKEIETKRVLVHVGDDIQVLSTFPDQYFDWVYIDTSHAYEHTRQELQILDRKVKDNGVIAGDDWQPDPDHPHHGVYKAVNEFVDSNNYKMIYANIKDRQWAIKKS